MKPHGVCRVTINHNTAKVRTRRRVRENGPIFDWYENTNRTDAILLRSPMTGWMGWLPLDEIVLSEATRKTEDDNGQEGDSTQ